MKMIDFFKDRLFYIISKIFAIVLLTIEYSKTKQYEIFFVLMIFMLLELFFIVKECLQKYAYYTGLKENLGNMFKYDFIPVNLLHTKFIDEKITLEFLRSLNVLACNKIEKNEDKLTDYKEYIESWIHEIKVYISSIDLIAQRVNTPDSQKILSRIDKICKLVEQVLYYAKIQCLEQDYIIKRYNLKEIINTAVKNNSMSLIESKIKIKISDVDEWVYADEKWILFVLSQIFINSTEYKQKHAELKIYSKNLPNCTELYIEDNGIGIPEKDIEYVFDKGFTGTNGRRYAKSTGMGLYICQKLCTKMGLQISVDSQENKFTTVKVTFPKNEILLEVVKEAVCDGRNFEN